MSNPAEPIRDRTLVVAVLGSLVSLGLFATALMTPAFEFEFDEKETAMGYHAFMSVPSQLWFLCTADSWEDLGNRWRNSSLASAIGIRMCVSWLPNPLLLVGIVALLARRWWPAMVIGVLALLGALAFAFWYVAALPFFIGYYLWTARIVILVIAAGGIRQGVRC